MKNDKPITVQLDRPRALAWGDLAVYRLGTLSRPPSIVDLQNQRKAYSALLAFLWAAIEDSPEDFAGPEALVRFLPNDSDKFAECVKALFEVLRRDAFPSQKKSSS